MVVFFFFERSNYEHRDSVSHTSKMGDQKGLLTTLSIEGLSLGGNVRGKLAMVDNDDSNAEHRGKPS